LGAVHLVVSDLERSLDFYQRALGLRVHGRDGALARLGGGGADLLALRELPGARRVRRHSGLYHFALLTPSRQALAQVLRNLAAERIELGGSDHLVSEALYLSDPDGNGIEVYRDRPRAEWPYAGGQLQMDTIPLDYHNVLAELAGQSAAWDGIDAGTTLGHMHLHVGDLTVAEAFYRDLIGLEVMVRYGGSALFLAAGGYHHHLGLNTWNGVGAPPAPADAVGLERFELVLASQAELDGLRGRLAAAGQPFEAGEGRLTVRDPFGNQVEARL
ncbi:MAG TPA: VOC family protein, partial [Herpetosiphonaceae bacterium]